MHLSLRAKLMSIVAATAVSFAVVIVFDVRLVARQNHALDELEQRLVPKLELEPRLTAQFEQMAQAFKDGVAAQDRAAIEATDQIRQQMSASLAQAGSAIDPVDAQALQEVLIAYQRTAINVSLRLLDGEAGEELVGDMTRMQEQHKRTLEAIERAARLDRQTLRDGFDGLHRSTAEAARYRLSVALVALTLVIGLSVWLGRGALRSLARITHGFERFAQGKLNQPIVPASADELGTLAHEANHMAAALLKLGVERDAADWIKAGQLELAEKLRGDLEPAHAAQLALGSLAERMRAVAGALFLDAGDDQLLLSASFAHADHAEPASRRLRLGEGLVGQAALDGRIRVIEQLPPDYLRVRTGLGDAAPRQLVLMPLRRGQRTIGVAELALFEPCSEAAREFLEIARESLAVALESAQSRAQLRRLLEESQTQAERLEAQEEELVQSNNELSAQQEELRLANDELEAQRSSLRARNAELEQMRASLQEKADELSKVSAYKSQFLANMSHELRTPLNSMLLLSQILADNEAENLTAKQVEHCRTIYSAGKGLLALINQVLDLSKIEAGKQELNLEPVVLAELGEQLRRTFEPQFTNKRLDFSVDVDPDLPRSIQTDGQCLQRILINLLGNALKFTERGRVQLRIGRPLPGARLERASLAAGSIAFAVRDTGVGIPKQVQARIFGRFEQADSRTVRRYGGTGLGLSIARESAQLMGGELRVESVEGQGSTFTCYLPEQLSPPSTSALAREQPPPPSLPPTRIADDRERVTGHEPYLLVVEDDPVFAERLVDIVRSLGLLALAASTGREALRLARAHPPAGIVLDVQLPDIDGFAVRQSLLSDPATSSIPIHFLSAVDAPRGELPLSAGYLAKPAGRDAIIEAIQGLIRSAPAAPLRVLLVEDDVDQSDSLVELLARSNVEASAAHNADEAVRALSSGHFGCMILDLGLPDVDGLHLLEQLRTRTDLALPPVIVHTGRALSREETRRLREYTEAVVIKGTSSAARLLDEVQAFAGGLRESLQQKASNNMQLLAMSSVALEGTKVLIADDDMRTVYALSALLRGKGADVVVAETGREALRVLDEHTNVGAVLMDIMMPDMDGYETMRRLREQQRFATLPVIALTARAMKGERERCREAGASDYLTKPVDPAGLLSTLEHLLEREPPRTTLS